MATSYMTTDDLNRLGIKWRERDGALVPADRVGLHPEADARLAAATGSGPATVYRIEASVTNGPRFAIVGTLAEIDARLRSGLVGVDVATGATGKASEWPRVAEKMRAEWARTMASTLRIADEVEGMTAEKFVDIARAAKPSLVPAPHTLLPGDTLDAIIIGGLRISCPTVESGSADGFTLSARVDWETGRALQMVCTTGKPLAISTKTWTREASPLKFQSARVPFERVAFDVKVEARWCAAPGSYARAKAVDFTGAGATLTDGAALPAKPVALAAGQVWRVPFFTPDVITLVRRTEGLGQPWLIEGGGLIGAARLREHGHYLGTREDVAGRESAITDRPVYSESICRPVYGVGPDPIGREAGPSARAMRVGAAVAEGMARGVASTAPAMGLSRTPLGTMTPAAPRADSVLGPCVGAWLDGIAEAWYGVKRSAGETDEALRARCVAVRDAPPAPAAPTKPSPLAALRAEIDALIAADSGPFAHARAAALRSLGEPDGGEVAELRLVRLTAHVIVAYEATRGGQTTPRRSRDDHPGAVRIERALDIYERERARSDVYARPARRY